MNRPPLKPVFWVGSSLKDLKAMPEEVQDEFGFALYLAQTGGKHEHAKPLVQFRGAGVLEIVDHFDGNTYRAVYTVRLEGCIYVLHAFQKKSKQKEKTSQHDMEIIEARWKQAEETHQEYLKKGETERP